jgi:hypothetical protein
MISPQPTRETGGSHVIRALPYGPPLCLLAAFTLGAHSPTRAATHRGAPASSFQDLVALFNDWRNFQNPKLVAGIPDY